MIGETIELIEFLFDCFIFMIIEVNDNDDCVDVKYE